MGLVTDTMDKMGSYTTNSDVKQVFAVMGNEILKFLRGKKLYIYIAIIALFMAFDIGFMLIIEDDYGNRLSLLEDGATIAYGVLGDLSLVLLIMATLFASGAISSEFEERTALILLTKPIKRTTVLAGKYLASVFVGVATLLLYLIVALILILIGGGDLNGDLFAGLGVYLVFVFMTVAIAMLISSFAKKSSTSALLTLFFLLIFPLIFESVLGSRGVDTWFLIGSLRTSASAVLNGGGEPLRDIIAMLVWTVVPLAASVVLFKKRQF